MDNVDRQLVSLLRRDGRAALSDLAAALGLSRATVRARLRKLVDRGEIVGFTALVKDDVVKSPVRGLMMLGIEGRGTDRIVARLLGIAEVQAVHATNGKWDLIVEIGTETLEGLDRVLAQIRKLEGVATSETNLLLSTRKSVRLR